MKEMSLQEHLHDLRKAAIHVMWIVIISFGVTYRFIDEISNFLLVPLRDVLAKNNGRVVQLGVLDQVVAQFQLAFWSSLLISSPFWFRELWTFIRPALYPNEVRIIRPFLFSGFLLFMGGVVFGYYLLFPFAIETLLGVGVKDVEQLMSISDYLVLSCKVLIFLGIIFQLPNLVLILGFMGLVTKQSLRSIRPYVAVGLCIFAAVATPTPDMITMLVVWIPMLLLYELGILAVAWIVHPYLHKQHMGSSAPHNP